MNNVGKGMELPELGFANAPDPVAHPSHYTAYPVEVIEIIKATLGPEGFRAYCFGNEIKYRMRAGLKGDNAPQDIAKAMTYKAFREGTDAQASTSRDLKTVFDTSPCHPVGTLTSRGDDMQSPGMPGGAAK